MSQAILRLHFVSSNYEPHPTPYLPPPPGGISFSRMKEGQFWVPTGVVESAKRWKEALVKMPPLEDGSVLSLSQAITSFSTTLEALLRESSVFSDP